MILITGAAGFIGSVLACEFNKRGRKDIIVVDRLKDSSKWKNLRLIDFVDYIHADELFDKKSLLKNLSVIFHLGACSSTTETHMDFLVKNNVLYSRQLFDLSTHLGIPFIYASSGATYGDGERGYSETQMDLLPLNPYGYSKHLFDKWVLGQKKHPPHWYGIKFFNVYGPNEYHKQDMRSMVCKAFWQIKKTGRVHLFKSHKKDIADGEQIRDFLYVKDAVNALIAIMDKKAASGIYNLGTGQARSFNDLIKAVFSAMNLPVNIEYIPIPRDIRDQYQYITQAQMDKFNKAVPQFKFSSLEEGVTDYIQNHLNTENIFYKRP